MLILRCLRALSPRRRKVSPEEARHYRIYRDVEEISRLGSWELDLKSNELWWSQEVYRIFDKNSRDFMPSYEAFLELVHPEDRDAVNHAYQYSVEHHTPYEYKHRLLFPDGRIKFVIEKGKTFYDRQGRAVRSVGTVLDVTTLEELVMEVRRGRRLESLGMLVGGIVHDFNNLLGVIMGYSSMLLEKTRGEEDLESDIREIIKAARKAVDISSQLLAFSRNKSLEPVVVDLNERIMSLDSITRQLVGDDVIVHYQLDAYPANVLIGAAEFDQVLINLVSNAAHAMSSGGTLRIATRRTTGDDEEVVLEVGDSGCGIAPEHQSRILDPFFTTRPRDTSTGLGLPTVAAIVRKCGGILEFRSRPGQGTTFTLSFPACRDCGMVTSCGNCHYEPGSRSRARFAGLRVMLVEDDEMMRNLVENMLVSLGSQVVSFKSPSEAEAWYALNYAAVDLVVVDVVMPFINGPELAERLRRARPNVKVLFISGYTTQTIRKYRIDVDERHFLAKPFSVHSLQEKLRYFLQA